LFIIIRAISYDYRCGADFPSPLFSSDPRVSVKLKNAMTQIVLPSWFATKPPPIIILAEFKLEQSRQRSNPKMRATEKTEYILKVPGNPFQR